MKRKSCFFIGCRTASMDIYPKLSRVVEEHICFYGVTEFIVGRYGAFDRMAALAVAEAKKKHPEVILTLLMAYCTAVKKVEAPLYFDGSLYPEGMECVPKKLAILKANQYAARHSDYLIAYVGHSVGNTRKLLDFARSVCTAAITEL